MGINCACMQIILRVDCLAWNDTLSPRIVQCVQLGLYLLISATLTESNIRHIFQCIICKIFINNPSQMFH